MTIRQPNSRTMAARPGLAGVVGLCVTGLGLLAGALLILHGVSPWVQGEPLPVSLEILVTEACAGGILTAIGFAVMVSAWGLSEDLPEADWQQQE